MLDVTRAASDSVRGGPTSAISATSDSDVVGDNSPPLDKVPHVAGGGPNHIPFSVQGDAQLNDKKHNISDSVVTT